MLKRMLFLAMLMALPAPSYPLDLVAGWNLVGNSLNTSISVKQVFGDPASFASLWKWDAKSANWSFYSPALDAQGKLSAYAAARGYGVLTDIRPGEGFWVNASVPVSLAAQSGTAFVLGYTSLVPGWNLVATGNDIGPADFNRSLSAAQSGTPNNMTALWAWDAANSAWYFYAPSLDGAGTLADFIRKKGYEDFALRTLGKGTGFWINNPNIPSWIWGVTTDNPAVNTAQQIDALAALQRRAMVRVVFDLPSGGYPLAADYAPSAASIFASADIMGLPVDSHVMAGMSLSAVQARIAEYLSALGNSVKVWEVGNEVNGNWLGAGVMPKVEAMYDAVKAAGKPAALTLYYENPPTPGYDMIPWVDANIPPGHRMRVGLDYVFVSYYEDMNGGHQLSQTEIDGIFGALSSRFPNARLGFGEFGWGKTIPSQDAARAALIRRFYNYRVPSVPNFVGGGFYWHFRQTMAPRMLPDWSVLYDLGRAWSPSPVTSWQWQLSGAVDPSFNVGMYDIDLFNNDASVVASLHAAGRKVVCYMNAGAYESWRADAVLFPSAVLGNALQGWPGEKWLDIRRLDILGPIMKARLDECRQKGFDAVEPDNIDGFSNNTGFPLTAADQIQYNIFLAQEAHNRGLSIALKNDLNQVQDLLPYFDWALNEQCFEFNECGKLTPFLAAGKAVFNVEYNLSAAQFCQRANQMNFNSLKKNLGLDSWQASCR